MKRVVCKYCGHVHECTRMSNADRARLAANEQWRKRRLADQRIVEPTPEREMPHD